MSDYPEYHTKKGKGAGITKIEGTGRKAGGEGTEKTMVAAFKLATYLEILYFWKKKKKLAERPLVCYTAVFSVGGALRDDTKNGCVAD